MIVVQLTGGLGNQMFGYACGRALALRTGKQLYLDLSSYPVHPLRRYELDKLNIQAPPPIHSLGVMEEIKCKMDIKSLKVVKERNFEYDPNIISIRDNVVLANGYWQSEMYFQDFSNIIREEFSPIQNSLSPETMNMAMNIKSQVSIAIHVRRGDYSISPIHRLLPMDYYVQAIEYIKSRIQSARFFIFSDDIEWCKHNFTITPEIYIVEHSGNKNNHEDLWLMSQCQHNIIANSTYSWWGAWLNNNPQKIVIAPDRWFTTSHMNIKDLVPEAWIKLPK